MLESCPYFVPINLVSCFIIPALSDCTFFFFFFSILGLTNFCMTTTNVKGKKKCLSDATKYYFTVEDDHRDYEEILRILSNYMMT